MASYDPDIPPAPQDWLETDEGERIESVAKYHRRQRIELPNQRVHAVFHVIVENQIALGEEAVVNTLARLQTEGLSRHDALHAIGSVLAEHLYDVTRASEDPTDDTHQKYYERLQHLTADA